MGYLLVNKKMENSVYSAEVVDNSIVLSIDGLKIKELDAWGYNRRDLELILALEHTNMHSDISSNVRKFSSCFISSDSF